MRAIRGCVRFLGYAYVHRARSAYLHRTANCERDVGGLERVRRPLSV